MFTRCRHARFGEQAVSIKSLKERRNLLCCFQFIERTKRAVELKNKAVRFQDNPRRLGKSRVRLVGQAPLKPHRKVRQRRQNSPVPLAMFAHRQMRMRDLAARGDEKPLRVESSSPGKFRAWANRSYPEGIRLQLCISTVRATLAVRRKPDPPGKAAERRTK